MFEGKIMTYQKCTAFHREKCALKIYHRYDLKASNRESIVNIRIGRSPDL